MRNIQKHIIIALLVSLFLSLQLVQSQSKTIKVNGLVSGLGMQDLKIIKKLKKNINFEGSLSGVSVLIKSKWTTKRAKTSLDGIFEIELPIGGRYEVSISKKGYSTLNYELVTGKKNLLGFNVLLEKGDEASQFVGKISAMGSGKYKFKKNDAGLVKSITRINQDLVLKTIKISNSQKIEKVQSEEIEEEFIEDEAFEDEIEPVNESIDQIVRITNKLNNIMEIDTTSDVEIDGLQDIIDSARIALSKLDGNSNEYKNLLGQIRTAENKLSSAKEIISIKDDQLKEQKKVLLFIALFLVALLALVIVMIFFLKKLREKNTEISTKNEKIHSSMEYAALIQNALLPDVSALKNYFKDAFCYNSPKDVVSGDFYWFAEVGNTVVIAVADCTGHGVPGALLTMLGHSALETIVIQNKETDPGKVIVELDKAITGNLKDDNPYQLNGMDISIIRYDKVKNELLFCGAMREIVVVSKSGELVTYKPEMASIASGRLKTTLENQKVMISNDDTLFMFSDGYQDQFSSNINTIETYNAKRFNELLIKVSSKESLQGATKFLQEDLNKWKGSRNQIDDVLVFGIRF